MFRGRFSCDGRLAKALSGSRKIRPSCNFSNPNEECREKGTSTTSTSVIVESLETVAVLLLLYILPYSNPSKLCKNAYGPHRTSSLDHTKTVNFGLHDAEIACMVRKVCAFVGCRVLLVRSGRKVGVGNWSVLCCASPADIADLSLAAAHNEHVMWQLGLTKWL
eukprot:3547139-Amphidinium_carterae.2